MYHVVAVQIWSVIRFSNTHEDKMLFGEWYVMARAECPACLEAMGMTSVIQLTSVCEDRQASCVHHVR